MSFIPFKEVNIGNPGPPNKYGSDQMLEVMQILNGKVVSNRRPKIVNEWVWLDHFDVQAPATAPSAPTDTNTNRVYTDPTDLKLKTIKTGGAIAEIENQLSPPVAYADLVLTNSIADTDIAASGITTRSKLPSSLAYEDEANTFTNTQTINKTAQPASTELLQEWKVSDNSTGVIALNNRIITDGHFRPEILLLASDNGAIRLSAQTTVANDAGSLPVMSFDAMQDDFTDITTRPLFAFRNNITEIIHILITGVKFYDAKDIILGTITGTKIGTATTQRLGFFNATPVVQRLAIASPTADVASLKTAVDAIRQALIDLGLTA